MFTFVGREIIVLQMVVRIKVGLMSNRENCVGGCIKASEGFMTLLGDSRTLPRFVFEFISCV